MRKVTRDLSDRPNFFESEELLTEIQEIAKDPTRDIIGTYYRASYKYENELKKERTGSESRDILNKYYHNKCAFCESTCYSAEIEHYRPKKRVVGISKNDHKGYYWLAYEWTNFLPACSACNTGGGGKGNHFTILGIRVSKPSFLPNGNLDTQKCLLSNSPLTDEEPYLLHPEIDDPKEHLGFSVSDVNQGVKIIAIDVDVDTPNTIKTKGRETIRICNLNRSDLKINRLKVLKEIYNMLIIPLNAYLDNKMSGDLFMHLFNGILEICLINKEDETLDYTLLRNFLMDSKTQFNSLIFPFFSNSYTKEILNLVVENYMSKNINGYYK